MRFLALLFVLAAGCAEESSPSPKEDCDALVDVVLPFARQMLVKHRAFHPYGSTMSADGTIAQTAGWTGEEHPDANEVIALLEDGYRKGAASGKLRATALVVDVRTIPPGKTEKQDSILIALDHRDSYSVHLIFPYSFTPEGELVVEEPFTRKGAGTVFAR